MRKWGAVTAAALVPALLALYAWLVYRTSWISEDAFITLRTCDNALAGYGLRWNVAERVQTYTHPLWMLVLLAVHAATGEPFYGTQYVSIAVSCAAVAILFFGTKGGLFERALALAMLLLSKAFIDYSTSGLENPLSHLWVACFVALYVREPKPASLGALAAVAGLAAVTRFDTAILYGPAWLLRASSHRRAAIGRGLAIAAAPLCAWLAFSVVYYGFPWPNTAYAKLAIGEIAGSDRLLEAYHYFEASWHADPITLGGWLAIAVLMIARRDRARLALLAGSALSFLYVVRIGGDFMAGRFFSAPYFAAVACLASSHALAETRQRIGAAALVLALAALGAQRPPLFLADDFGANQAGKNTRNGVWDSRAEFFPHSSLTHAHEITPADPRHAWSAYAQALRKVVDASDRTHVQLTEAIGFQGYYAGPRVHFVDYWALADPLLARLPAAFGGIGHYTRPIPSGYPETLASGRNMIRDPVIAEYYDQLVLAVRGPLFTRERLRAIWRLNTGAYTARLRDSFYVEADALVLRARVVNLSPRREAIVYVWNAHERVEHLLDDASALGEQYEVTWRITADGPVLLSPKSAPRVDTIGQLAERGIFTISAVFRSSLAPGDNQGAELQFHYAREGRRLKVLREPTRHIMSRVPLEPSRQAPALQGLEVLELRAE